MHPTPLLDDLSKPHERYDRQRERRDRTTELQDKFERAVVVDARDGEVVPPSPDNRLDDIGVVIHDSTGLKRHSKVYEAREVLKHRQEPLVPYALRPGVTGERDVNHGGLGLGLCRSDDLCHTGSVSARMGLRTGRMARASLLGSST